MSGITDFLKKDLSFKRKPSTTAEAPKAETPMAEEAPKQDETPKSESPKRGLSRP